MKLSSVVNICFVSNMRRTGLVAAINKKKKKTKNHDFSAVFMSVW